MLIVLGSKTQLPSLKSLTELKVSLRRTGIRGRVDRCLIMQVHAALFPNVRLLAVSERSIRSATLIVAVTDTNLHNCCLTSDSDLTAI